MDQKDTSKSATVLKRLKLLRHWSLIWMVGLGLIASQAEVMAKNAPRDPQGSFSQQGYVESQPEPTIEAFIAAAEGGNVKEVKNILNEGVDVNSQGKDGKMALHEAASNGHVEAIKILLAHGANPNVQGPDGKTPLYRAMEAGHVEAAEVLVAREANPQAQDDIGRAPLEEPASWRPVELPQLPQNQQGFFIQILDYITPQIVQRFIIDLRSYIISEEKRLAGALQAAARDGNVKKLRKILILEKILKRGEVVNSRDRQGNTPLHLAAANGHVEAIEVLIKHGAEVYAQITVGTFRGDTPLDLAAFYEQVGAIEALLKHGVSLEDQDQWGKTPLHKAALHGPVRAIEILIEHGANLDTQDKGGYTPLHWVGGSSSWWKLARSNEAEVMKMLIEHGANLDAQDKGGYTPLHWIVWYEQAELIKILIEHGANLHAQDKDGWTPLHWAVRSGKAELIKMLIEHGASLETQDKEGYTPLHWAEGSWWKWWKSSQVGMMIKARLEYELDFAIRNKDGKVLLDLASQQPEIQELFAEHINKPLSSGLTPLGIAAKHGNIKAMELFVSYGAEIETKDGEGFTAMQRALEADQTESVKFLATLELNKGLLAASERGDQKALEHFLNLNADINARDVHRHTPLMLALKHDHIELAWELIRKGAHLKAVSKQGTTALHFAANSEHPLSSELVQYLLQQRRNAHQEDALTQQEPPAAHPEHADSKGASGEVLAQEEYILL